MQLPPRPGQQIMRGGFFMPRGLSETDHGAYFRSVDISGLSQTDRKFKKEAGLSETDRESRKDAGLSETDQVIVVVNPTLLVAVWALASKKPGLPVRRQLAGERADCDVLQRGNQGFRGYCCDNLLLLAGCCSSSCQNASGNHRQCGRGYAHPSETGRQHCIAVRTDCV